jgi:methionyl-tRNA formyltransferase
MRLVFLGTPEVAATTLRTLVTAGHDVALVVTRADAKRGRGSTLVPSPVKREALEQGIPVAHRASEAVAAGAELGVVVAYGRIIKPDVLAALPMVNLHFSLLPRWRGAAPVERAVLAGDELTGVCLMAVEEGLDTGGVYRRAVTPIDPEESVEALRRRLGALGDELLLQALAEGLGRPEPQEGEPTYAAKIEPRELRLDFCEPALMGQRRVRLGRAWTTLAGKRLLVLDAAVDPAASGEPGSLTGVTVATPQGGLILRLVQPEGRKALPAAEWSRGARLEAETRLGT